MSTYLALHGSHNKKHLSFRHRAVRTLLIAVLAFLSVSLCTSAFLVQEVHLPILMFHHIDEAGKGDATITPAHFEALVSKLASQGYESVTIEQVIRYVEEDVPLPEKPVLITFDDGYESVVLRAVPVLREYRMAAASFVIGVSVGKETYKDTGIPIIPHFTWNQARAASDILSVQSHTFDMHQVPALDTSEYRYGVLKKEGERQDTYLEALRNDFTMSLQEIERNLGAPAAAFAYPHGQETQESEAILRSLGVRMTLTTVSGVNTIISGDLESLFSLKRIHVTEDLSPEALIAAMQ